MAETKPTKTKKKGGNNNGNLKTPTTEEARERGRKGGIASARKRQERKSMAETLEILLKMPSSAGPIDSLSGIESAEAIKSSNITLWDKMMVAAVNKALKGDIHAMEFIREMLGESPKSSAGNVLADFGSTLLQMAEKMKDESTEGWEE